MTDNSFNFSIKQVYTTNIIVQSWGSNMQINLFIQNVKQIGSGMMLVPAAYIEVVECGQDVNYNSEEAPCMQENMYNETLEEKYENRYMCFYIRVNSEYNVL